MLHSVYDRHEATAVHERLDRFLDYTTEKLPAVFEHVDVARADIHRLPETYLDTDLAAQLQWAA